MNNELSVEFIALVERSLTNERQRSGIISKCCPAVLRQLDCSGSVSEFAPELWRVLVGYGEVIPGKPAVIAFLEQLREDVGVDVQQKIDNLIYTIYSNHMGINQTPPPRSEDIREQWMLDTLWDVNTLVSTLNERVLRVYQTLDTLNDVRKNIEENRRDIARNRRDVWINRILITLVIIGEVLTLAFILSGARII
jgi:hypothetical protein